MSADRVSKAQFHTLLRVLVQVQQARSKAQAEATAALQTKAADAEVAQSKQQLASGLDRPAWPHTNHGIQEKASWQPPVPLHLLFTRSQYAMC